MPSNLPAVTVVMPVFNEVRHIDEVLGSLAEQDYPGEWEILVPEGGSTDGTRQRLEEWRDRLPNLRVIDNPERVQTVGVNRAVERAKGEIICRVDGHTTYAPDYVRRAVEALLGSQAVAVGGLMRPRGTNPFGRAVAAAMSSPLAVGPGKFHYSDRRQETDTAFLATFRRKDFLRAGGYRAFPSGVGEDAELHHRWRREGRTILLDPAIRTRYRPRERPADLWRQFFRYGWSKAEMFYLNGSWPTWRPLAPLLLVLGLLAGAMAAALGLAIWPLLALSAAWLAVLVLVALRTERPHLTFTAVAIMHLAYGLGLLSGLLRGPGPMRRLRRGEAPQALDRPPDHDQSRGLEREEEAGGGVGGGDGEEHRQ